MKFRIHKANTISAYTTNMYQFCYMGRVQDYLDELRQHALWENEK